MINENLKDFCVVSINMEVGINDKEFPAYIRVNF